VATEMIFFVTGSIAAIELLLRRTLQRFVRYPASNILNIN